MTQKKQKQICKDILNKYELGQKVNKSDSLYLIDIFKNHPNWNEKRGVGGCGIIVKGDQFGHRCFFIERTDGTLQSISYIKSISGRKLSDLAIIKKACRNSIRPEIEDFKKKNVIFNKTKCAISGEILTKENINIDHYDFTFSEMINLWLAGKNENEIVKKIIKVGQVYEYRDLIFRDNFIKFHNKFCKLRAVTKTVNQKLPRK